MLESVKLGKKPWEWTADELVRFAPEFRPEMAELLRPIVGIHNREVPGGTGARTVARALDDAERRVKEMNG